MTRKAKTLLELTREEILAALPAEVVAAPGTHSVWSVIWVVVSPESWRFWLEVFLLSPESMTFQPLALLVERFRVVVAARAVPGVMFAN